jgi:hypothetical protein
MSPPIQIDAAVVRIEEPYLGKQAVLRGDRAALRVAIQI